MDERIYSWETKTFCSCFKILTFESIYMHKLKNRTDTSWDFFSEQSLCIYYVVYFPVIPEMAVV